MKLNEVALANASAILMGGFYVLCALAVVTLPELFQAVAVSWFHGVDLGAIWTGQPRGNFLLGLISAVVLSWVGGWVFAWLYNRLSKK